MRSSVSSTHSQHEQDLPPSTPPTSGSTASSVEWTTSSSSSITAFAADDCTLMKSESVHSQQASPHHNPDSRLEAMVPSQTQPPYQSMQQAPYYPASDYSIKPHSPQSTQYMPQGSYSGNQNPYATLNRSSIHERRQSLLVGQHQQQQQQQQQKHQQQQQQQQQHQSGHMPQSPDLQSRAEYPVPVVDSTSLSEDITTTVSSIDISHASTAAWDPSQPQAQDAQSQHANSIDGSSAPLHLPPLSEALHRNTQCSPLAQSQQIMTNMDSNNNSNSMLTTASPVGYYTQIPLGDIPPQRVNGVYSVQDQFENSDPSKMPSSRLIRHGSPVHAMMSPNSNVNVQGYGRRVTYPFVPSIDTSSGLMMTSLTSPENSGSSPLMANPFAHGGMVGVNSVPVQGMVQSSPLVGYMDAMTLQQQPHSHPSQGPYPHSLHQSMPPHHSTPQQQAGSAWLPKGAMTGVDDGQNGGKVYSFVPLSGVNTKKRPRRRFDEIERLYVCNWADCEKSYGTLNHLNAHVNMQKHGPKRHPSEFKELRKAWRKHKKAEEEAAKQAAAFHQQQTQGQLQICDPLLTNMQPHPLAMHPMSHHQPHQLPHPHAHPNQHQHLSQGQAQQQHPYHHHHHHPMGF
ncbi:hypothetical protein BGZ75_009787 [Mortierella antarctica]|nr:hypothetical protein BGZ75_009787 [Mortierella antarctica]